MSRNHSITKTLLIANLLLAGCNLNSPSETTPQVIYITPTGGGPLMTVPPTVPPTATTPPDVALRFADRQLLNGYYEQAVAAYQVVLDEGAAAPQDLQAAAALGLGKAALREGLFVDA